MPSVAIRAVMKNGTVIFPNSGVGSPTDDNTEMVMTYIWRIPLNLDEVGYLLLGDEKGSNTKVYIQ